MKNHCKGTAFFPYTQTNSQKYCRFSIYRVLFPISYNYTPAQFHALKTHANALRARRALVHPIIASTLLVNLHAKTSAYIRAEVNIKADVRTVAAVRIVRRYEIHKPRARDCSLVSGILTKSVSLSFCHFVHNLTNIFLYFRRKSHGCVRVRTRNYFLYFYIISIYY